jgi:hypothetical protein
MRRTSRLRAFARVTKNGDIVPSSIILRRNPPKSGGQWIELDANSCCKTTTTSTTTTTTTTL